MIHHQIGGVAMGSLLSDKPILAMAQNYQPPKWMVFLLNMIISVGHLVP